MGYTRTGLVLIAACLSGVVAAPAAQARKKPAPKAHLSAFSSCAALTAFARSGAHRTDGATGVPVRAVPGFPTTISSPSPMLVNGDKTATPAPVAAPTESGAPADAGTPFSTTNTQESDVDEPDVVKSDGKHLYAITDRTLRVIDVTGATPQLVGALTLDGYGQQLLLRNNRVLVISTPGFSGYGYAERQVSSIAPYPYPGGRARTIVTEISVADAAKPEVLRQMTIDGAFVDARQNGGTARLVISSAPDPVQPDAGQSVDDAIDDTSASNYLGSTVLKSKISGHTFRRQLVKCAQVRHPRAFSGLDVLTIMTVDLDRGLYSLDRDGVMAGAQVVYGSSTSLYVASERYDRRVEIGHDVPTGRTTEIHRFDVTDPDATTYKSSGTVSGFILNSYAMSEYKGDLRVASTQDPLWFGGDVQATDSESAITVLRESDGRLNAVGKLSGLGKTERIYAARFIGDVGYLVTFRQVDPLYTLDLSKPSAPRVVGELKIPGFSAYLHPVGDDKLLGVGQEADDSGRLQGSQLSLFDVSDPAAPKRVAQLKQGPGAFAAASDPHAFLYWAPTRLGVLPLQTYGDGVGFSGALGVRVGGAAGLAEVARVAHKPRANDASSAPEISRALVVGDTVYTLSFAGLQANALSDLSLKGFTAFPVPAG